MNRWGPIVSVAGIVAGTITGTLAAAHLADHEVRATVHVVAQLPGPASPVVYIGEHTTGFDAEPGDLVVEVMDDASPAAVDRCLNAGGEPILNPRTNVLYCEGIDF